MTKLSENSHSVIKLSHDDQECAYVNRMMEMPSSIIRELLLSGETYESMYGIVPTVKLPTGYNFGNISSISKHRKDYDKIGVRVNSQNSSNSNSTVRMESDERDNEINQGDEYMKMIKTVQGDILMSDDDDDHDNDNSSITSNNTEYIEDHGKLLFDTLNSCSQKLPNLNSINMFQKHYTGNKQELPPKTNDEIKKESKLNPPCETEPAENDLKSSGNYQHHLKQIIEILSKSSSKDLLKSFQPVYDLIKDRKRKLELPKVDEIDATNTKVLKLSKIPERKKYDGSDLNVRIYSKNNDCNLSMDIIPELTKDKDFEKFKNIVKIKSECIKQESTVESCTRPKYVTQDSLPFYKSENSTKNELKVSEDNSAGVSAPQSFLNNQSTDNAYNQVKKPEAAAKQFYLQSTHSAISNHPKVAVVTGNVNKAQTKFEATNKTCSLPSLNINSVRSLPNQSASRSSLSYKDNDNDAEESKVVQGLSAMRKMRNELKSDFIERMRNLDMTKWLTEVRSLKEKATSCKRQLDYAPHIMVYIRKNLFYNYSLEVKTEYRKSHNTYLENAKMIKQYCYEITQTYNEQEANITDTSSTRLWNIKLVKHFTVVMCHKLSAILQYRSFRNVHEDCRKTREMLVKQGIIDRNDRPNQFALTENHHQVNSPFSSFSPFNYGQISTHNSSPRLCTSINGSNSALMSSNNAATTLTQDIKLKLQKYMDQTTIINTAYSDWMLAEIHFAKFCSRSSRHDESWRDFEWKIVEKSEGVIIESIDESIPFVIKYLEGYINYMNEFMKQNL